jgi:pyridoxal phosphate enzyme (YggS family)
MSGIRGRLEAVMGRIAEAARRAGRDASEVTLVAVSKTMPPETVRAALEAGVKDVGENRVQEARDKLRALGGPGTARWHLVGHLQTNKARLAVELFDMIHSVDSIRLARELEKHAGAAGKTLPCLIEVNQAGEQTKSGMPEAEVGGLLEAMRAMTHVRAIGLMAIPPFLADPEEVRPYFRRLRAARDRLVAEGVAPAGFTHLSMGMTHDFPVAIEEGATLVRIGTAIFGPRTGK